MKRMILTIVVAQLFSTAAFAAENKDAGARRRARLSYLVSMRGNYVFAGSDDAKVSNLGLVAGKDYGRAGEASGFRPFGIEGELRLPVGGGQWHLTPEARVVPTSLKLRPADAEQDGVDALVALSIGAFPKIGEDMRFGAEVGLRARRWQLESGAFPSTTHAGLIVRALFACGPWDALAEAGLMGLGIRTPKSLGIQRDSSTLRLRVAREFGESAPSLAPWIEFFHTHRDFYGATVLPGETSLFVDEASLSAGLAFEL